MSDDLRVVAAALYVEFNGYECTFSVPRPGRHSDVISAMSTMGAGAHVERARQGFLLSDGYFARRSEAWCVARRAGQIIKRVGGDGENLYSENVW